MTEAKTYQTKVKSTTVITEDGNQADVCEWANAEGVTIAVSDKNGTNIMTGQLTWQQMEAVVAAYALLKT